jgi:hypothetical protein
MFRALQQPKWRTRAAIEHGLSVVLKLAVEVERTEALAKQQRATGPPSRSAPVRVPVALAKRKHFLQKQLAEVWSLPSSAQAAADSSRRSRGEEVEEDYKEWPGLELLKLLKGKKLLRRSLRSGMLSLRQRVALLEKAAKYLVHFVYSTALDERDTDEADALNAEVTASLVEAFEAPNIPLTCLTSCLRLLTQSQTLEMIPYLLQFKASADVVRVLLVRGEAAAEEIANPKANANDDANDDKTNEEEEEDAEADGEDGRGPNWRSRNGSQDASPEEEAKRAARAEARAKARAQAVVDWHAALDALKAKIAEGTAHAAGGAE